MAEFLSESLAQARIAPRDPATMTPDLVASTLGALAAAAPASVRLTKLGRSYFGREVVAATIGAGPRRILAWSQMHGDEPTHTAVLVDLLSWLIAASGGVNAQASADSDASAILNNCTLTIVPMLNPDGAVLGRRENAQGIDVNRDARRLASPEGRMLRAAVERFQPEFAFNLHNQNARSTVGRSKRPSVVALMAPPLDFGNPETEQILRAKQVAVCFRRVVEPHCPGMISRYSADYMPRAFGEWVQSSGVTTVLVEAGGSPDDTAFDMVGLHLLGLAKTLAAIARDEVADADPAEYDALPLDGEIVRFDRVVERTTVVRGTGRQPFVADLGINFPGGRRLSTGPLVRGTIEEIGDLEVTTGKQSIAAAGLSCLPGAWAAAPNVTPLQLPSDGRWSEFMERGVATVVGVVDPTDQKQLAALKDLAAAQEPVAPLNLAFVATLPAGASVAPAEAARLLLLALHQGAAAIDAQALSPETRALFSAFRLPRVDLGELPAAGGGLDERADAAARWAEAFGQAARGRLDKGALADAALVASDAADFSVVDLLIGGESVYHAGRATGVHAGVLIRAPG